MPRMMNDDDNDDDVDDINDDEDLTKIDLRQTSSQLRVVSYNNNIETRNISSLLGT